VINCYPVELSCIERHNPLHRCRPGRVNGDDAEPPLCGSTRNDDCSNVRPMIAIQIGNDPRRPIPEISNLIDRIASWKID